MFSVGLTVGVIGAIVPKEMIRNAWIAVGIALFGALILSLSTAAIAYVVAWARGYSIGFYFPDLWVFFYFFFLLLTIVAFVIIVLKKRR